MFQILLFHHNFGNGWLALSIEVCTHIACDSPQMDHDPKNPSYIATQGPLAQTVSDFWQVGCYAMSIVNVKL